MEQIRSRPPRATLGVTCLPLFLPCPNVPTKAKQGLSKIVREKKGPFAETLLPCPNVQTKAKFGLSKIVREIKDPLPRPFCLVPNVPTKGKLGLFNHMQKEDLSPTRTTSKQPNIFAANSWSHGGGRWLVQTGLAPPWRPISHALATKPRGGPNRPARKRSTSDLSHRGSSVWNRHWLRPAGCTRALVHLLHSYENGKE